MVTGSVVLSGSSLERVIFPFASRSGITRVSDCGCNRSASAISLGVAATGTRAAEHRMPASDAMANPVKTQEPDATVKPDEPSCFDAGLSLIGR